MLFNSLEFLIFLPILVAIYFAIPHKFRWVLLLLSSYYFYACWKPEYVILILISTSIDYWCGIRMTKHENKQSRKKYLFLSLAVNLGILGFFKYFNFFSEAVNEAFSQFNIFYEAALFDYLLPVGISFYTFQTMSYSIDVYNGKIKAERHFGYFALFVSFFPQLVAGPIERASNILPQFRKNISFNYERVRNGILLIIIGFYKKVIIADRLAEYVNEVYQSPLEYGGVTNLIASYFFYIQIYCDFSGYSDIAIGSALILGISLMNNFKQPFFAINLKDFWQRWHISLSTWFKDYLYIPLGGNRVVKWKWHYNLIITFLLSGLWHGANWTFIAWGAIHGFGLIISFYLLSRIQFKKLGLGKNIARAIQIIVTFHLVTFSFIVFRANSLSDSLLIIKGIFDFSVEFINAFYYPIDLWISLAAIAILFWAEAIQESYGMVKFLWNRPSYFRYSLTVLTLIALMMFGIMEGQDFIYFQF